MLTGKKLVIFDVYGTLLSTGTGSVDAARSILAHCDAASGEMSVTAVFPRA